jgi:lipopolysaccharide transport system permease protein
MAVAPDKPVRAHVPLQTVSQRAKTAAALPVRVFEPRKAGLVNSVREVWRFRHLAYFFGAGFLEKRYGRSFLGLLWVPLRPGIALITKIFVYGGLIGAAAGNVPYALAFLTGTAAWEIFREGVTWSARSIQVNRKQVERHYMPRALLGLSAIVPTSMEGGINVFYMLVGVAWYAVHAHHMYIQFSVLTLLAPLGLFLALAMGIGVGLTMSGLGARGRDIQFGLPFILGLGYFVTPVIYPLTTVPPNLRRIEELNPMAGAVEMIRDGLFHTHSLSFHAALVPVIATAVIWGPVYLLMDRREVRLLRLPAGHTRGRRARRAEPSLPAGS